MNWFAQISTDSPESILAAVILLGSAIVGGLLTGLRTLWKENQIKNEQLISQSREMTKVVVDATNRIHESEQTVEAATKLLHSVAATQLKPEQLSEIAFYLRQLRDRV